MMGLGGTSPFHRFTNPRRDKSVYFWPWGSFLPYTWRLKCQDGDKVDIIRKDNDPFLPLPNDNIYASILPRVSSDKCVINQSGN